MDGPPLVHGGSSCHPLGSFRLNFSTDQVKFLSAVLVNQNSASTQAEVLVNPTKVSPIGRRGAWPGRKTQDKTATTRTTNEMAMMRFMTMTPYATVQRRERRNPVGVDDVSPWPDPG